MLNVQIFVHRVPNTTLGMPCRIPTAGPRREPFPFHSIGRAKLTQFKVLLRKTLAALPARPALRGPRPARSGLYHNGRLPQISVHRVPNTTLGMPCRIPTAGPRREPFPFHSIGRAKLTQFKVLLRKTLAALPARPALRGPRPARSGLYHNGRLPQISVHRVPNTTLGMPCRSLTTWMSPKPWARMMRSTLSAWPMPTSKYRRPPGVRASRHFSEMAR